ncbi:methyltransferase domain-containing protein [Streptomyces sp. NPDC059913]|uniref:methyltransferase domain-containing protein n=1 Tax=unclassified Streptomyces TaxID=2593676 RepID=UPI003661E36F
MSTPTNLDRARPHMAALADALARDGAIRTPAWSQAFRRVPRHLFVPRWYVQERNERGISVWRESHDAATDDGLAAAYRDETLVTALDPDTAERVDATAWTGVPTSSSTLPRLMAGMLEDLGVGDGHRVLEIGTGTGYNAALLCHRLGDRLVTSVDIDPAVVDTARDRLAVAGFAPRLVPGDGVRGNLTGDRFDRIIATCSVPAVPAAWIGQSRPGTLLVTDIALGVEGGLVRLEVDEQGRALGHFTRPAAASCPPAPTPVRTRRRAGRGPPRRRASGGRGSPPRTCARTTPSGWSSRSTCRGRRSSTTWTTPGSWRSRCRARTVRGRVHRSRATTPAP